MIHLIWLLNYLFNSLNLTPADFKHLSKHFSFRFTLQFEAGLTQPTSRSTYRDHFACIILATRAHAQERVYAHWKVPSFRNLSLFLPPYVLPHCSAANSGFRGMKGVHVRNNIRTCEYVYECVTAIVCAHRARVLRADAERKINIKFTSRLRIHVDHEPRP